jgi:hypothetical protein
VRIRAAERIPGTGSKDLANLEEERREFAEIPIQDRGERCRIFDNRQQKGDIFIKLYVTCQPSRGDDPEIAAPLPRSRTTTGLNFDQRYR